MNLDNIDFAQVAILVAVLVISVVGHEIAHGYAAFKFGDLTAKNLGRLSHKTRRSARHYRRARAHVS